MVAGSLGSSGACSELPFSSLCLVRGVRRSGTAKALGQAAERHVAAALTAAGWTVLAHGWSVQGGELDLVAIRGGLLAFVEVKYRRRSATSWPTVSPAQQRRLSRTAEQFLAASPALEHEACSFVVAVVQGEPSAFTHELIFDAFDAATDG